MPDKYIVNMTEKTTPEDTNLLVIEDAADTKKITFTNLFKPIKDMIGNQEVESGSNSNGSYIKFSDGTQICWFNIQVNDQSIDIGYGSLFVGTRDWIYPAAFVSYPSVSSGLGRWGSSLSWTGVISTTVNTASLRFYDVLSRSTGTNMTISAMAIGRWK